MYRLPCSVVALVAWMLSACGQRGPTLAELTQDLAADNGVSLNGVSLNGVSPNGVSLNGVSLNGVSLNGVSLNGVSLNGVSLNGTELTGSTASGFYVSGAGLVGGRLTGTLSNGSSLALRIDGLTFDHDLAWYKVSYLTSYGWRPLCGTSDGVAIPALALAGTWDTRQGVAGGGAYLATAGMLTFACRNAAIGKCVELGYRPYWGGTWRDLHQACVRMLRADYCGDGRSWTQNGRAVNLYDVYRVQVDTESWNVEAEWTAAGAYCIRKRRVVSPDAPACARERQTPANDCGRYDPYDPFRPGTLLISEFQTQLVLAD